MNVLVNETLETKVVQIIRERILRNEPGYGPGARLFAGDLARRLGVSITPVQYAMKSLASDGLVEIRPRKGAFVAALEPDGVLEIWSAMLALQVGCLTLAKIPVSGAVFDLLRGSIEATRLSLDSEDWRDYLDNDINFHRLFVGISGNSLSLAAYDSLVVKLRHLSLTYVDYQRMDHGRDGVTGHQRMVGLLEGNDIQAVIKELIEDHRQSVKRITEARVSAFKERARRSR